MSVEPRARRVPRWQPELPRLLLLAGGWAWRLLAVGVAVYAAVRILAMLWLVVVPVVLAVLLASLLRPVSRLLQRARLPGPLAALVTLLLAVVVLGGIGFLVQQRVAAQLPTLVDQLVRTVRGLRSLLDRFGAGQFQLDQLQNQVITWLQSNRDQLVNVLQTGAGWLVDIGTMLLLTLFVCFFFLYDGERVWRALLLPFHGRPRERLDDAGHTAWSVVTGYVHGTAVIATIHGVVIGTVIWLLGVPLPVVLGVLVFLGSFIPLVGALVAGGIAVLVALGTQGWVAALILLAVLVAENQLEGHVLQPLIVGRYVRLHPLLIGIALTIGTVLAGVVGALVSVPTAAVLRHTVPRLLGHAPAGEEERSGDEASGTGTDSDTDTDTGADPDTGPDPDTDPGADPDSGSDPDAAAPDRDRAGPERGNGRAGGTDPERVGARRIAARDRRTGS
ncbi:AI-2E family transporter [Pseudonocardia sp. RS010]|uniref:AI-2E family transporter n=1 Tax=Pseudonocardia sp. RS010 TaxID=3385979 RepID=UPI00399F3327